MYSNKFSRVLYISSGSPILIAPSPVFFYKGAAGDQVGLTEYSVLCATVTFSADKLNLQHATFGEPSGGTFISHTAKRVSYLESFSSHTSTCEAKTDEDHDTLGLTKDGTVLALIFFSAV